VNVLLTNDDGIEAQGIIQLWRALKRRGDSVTVIAPYAQASGSSHAFTLDKPIYYTPWEYEDMRGFRVRGTPSDCVKFGIAWLLAEKPALVMSGINHGDNSGLSAFYSGTIAAAREGAFWGVPSFAVSRRGSTDAQGYAAVAEQAVALVFSIMRIGYMPAQPNRTTFYNINFPDCPVEEIEGVSVTRQSCAFFSDHYVPVEDDHDGLMLQGELENVEQDLSYDVYALDNKRIAVTPLQFDATDEPCRQAIEDSLSTVDIRKRKVD
jgi:5'-nucleotidase